MLQRSRESAAAATAHTLQISFWASLMSAAHSRAQRNDFDMHLDAAGDRFGAMARGGRQQRVLRVGRKCGILRTNEDEVHFDSAGHRFEHIRFRAGVEVL